MEKKPRQFKVSWPYNIKNKCFVEKCPLSIRNFFSIDLLEIFLSDRLLGTCILGGCMFARGKGKKRPV